MRNSVFGFTRRAGVIWLQEANDTSTRDRNARSPSLFYLCVFFRAKKSLTNRRRYLTLSNVSMASKRRKTTTTIRRRRRKMDRFFIQYVSRFEMKRNGCSHAFVLIAPCSYVNGRMHTWCICVCVYMCVRASERTRVPRKGEARSWENARLHAWRIKTRRRRRRRSQGRSISLLAQIQTYEQFFPDCFSLQATYCQYWWYAFTDRFLIIAFVISYYGIVIVLLLKFRWQHCEKSEDRTDW